MLVFNANVLMRNQSKSLKTCLNHNTQFCDMMSAGDSLQSPSRTYDGSQCEHMPQSITANVREVQQRIESDVELAMMMHQYMKRYDMLKQEEAAALSDVPIACHPYERCQTVGKYYNGLQYTVAHVSVEGPPGCPRKAFDARVELVRLSLPGAESALPSRGEVQTSGPFHARIVVLSLPQS
jgi:hypothetical protein